MHRIINMVMRHMLRAGVQKLDASGKPFTPEQKEAQRRVNKAIKASRRINRI